MSSRRLIVASNEATADAPPEYAHAPHSAPCSGTRAAASGGAAPTASVLANAPFAGIAAPAALRTRASRRLATARRASAMALHCALWALRADALFLARSN